MLTPEQIAVIDAIPEEGKAPFLLPDEERARLAGEPLEFAIAPPQGEAKAKILIGAPGSGKTHGAMSDINNSNAVYVSYDEGGAIFDIQDYGDQLVAIAPEAKHVHTPVSRDTLQARRELWLKYQNDSQNIRAQTLKLALKGQFDIVVDTTSSSMGTKFLIAALRQLPFKEITMEGMFAPFGISRERIEARPRPTSGLGDLVGKRIGALEWIPEYAKIVDRFDFYYNPSNDFSPHQAFRMAAGQPENVYGNAVQAMKANLAWDEAIIRRYLEEVQKELEIIAPEKIESLNVDEMMDRYKTAAAKMTRFMDEISSPRPSPAPSP